MCLVFSRLGASQPNFCGDEIRLDLSRLLHALRDRRRVPLQAALHMMLGRVF